MEAWNSSSVSAPSCVQDKSDRSAVEYDTLSILAICRVDLLPSRRLNVITRSTVHCCLCL